MDLRHVLVVLLATVSSSVCLHDRRKWDFEVTPPTGKSFPFILNVFEGTKLNSKINCSTHAPDAKVQLDLTVLQIPCRNTTPEDVQEFISLKDPKHAVNSTKVSRSVVTYICNEHMFIKEGQVLKNASRDEVIHLHEFTHDGVYVLDIGVNPNYAQYSILVHFEVKSDYGYLSAEDWPLLPFYRIMCVYYIILGLVWLVLSFLQWRDILRVQFWIGGVVLLGMLEKATFYAEYQSNNENGESSQGVIIFAEWVSCAKRTLARMLVIIVSLGFGIVKPRLGSTLHRVVGVGILYFFLAASEAYLRIVQSNSSANIQVASVPLAVLDSAICWWIFSALVNTTRTLRLRRNEAKLSLYRHFTNTLIFSVVASVIFMLYSMKVHRFASCQTVWKDMWLEDGFWHILFSCILLVIIILWRPTNNNQRYAFVPLLDTGDDNEEEDHLVNDAYGVKVRIHHQKQHNSPRNSVDEDLRWLEENVKSDPALPILDSDEELVNTRFEVSKMQ